MTAATAIARVNEEHGLRLMLGDRCPGGEVGAHYATADGGRRLVFKWTDDQADAGYFESVRRRVERLRDRGYPAPRYLPPLVIEGGVVVFQEAIAGSWDDGVDAALVETAIRLVDLQEGAARESSDWTSYIAMTLTDGADGYCLHEPLRAYGSETRALVEWVESVGREVAALPDGDLVHIDFHHRNMLRDADRFSGVVDW
jgi:thiamine kinase-like enzyme